MKRFVLIMCLIIGINTLLMAQETEIVPRFSLGGSSFLTSGFMYGGSADFAFLIYHNNNIDIRNHIVFRGGSFEDGGIILLLEKISFGGMIVDNWRTYGYIEGGIGFTANEIKSFFDQPFSYSIGGGGGTDIFLTEAMSIFFEVGGLFNITNGIWSGDSIFQIGWKSWF